jgi:hypothetical protein
MGCVEHASHLLRKGCRLFIDFRTDFGSDDAVFCEAVC